MNISNETETRQRQIAILDPKFCNAETWEGWDLGASGIDFKDVSKKVEALFGVSVELTGKEYVTKDFVRNWKHALEENSNHSAEGDCTTQQAYSRKEWWNKTGRKLGARSSPFFIGMGQLEQYIFESFFGLAKIYLIHDPGFFKPDKYISIDNTRHGRPNGFPWEEMFDSKLFKNYFDSRILVYFTGSGEKGENFFIPSPDLDGSPLFFLQAADKDTLNDPSVFLAVSEMTVDDAYAVVKGHPEMLSPPLQRLFGHGLQYVSARAEALWHDIKNVLNANGCEVEDSEVQRRLDELKTVDPANVAEFTQRCEDNGCARAMEFAESLGYARRGRYAENLGPGTSSKRMINESAFSAGEAEILIVEDSEFYVERVKETFDRYNERQIGLKLVLQRAETIDEGIELVDSLRNLQGVILDYTVNERSSNCLEHQDPRFLATVERTTRLLARYIKRRRPELVVVGLTQHRPCEEPDVDRKSATWVGGVEDFAVERVYYKSDGNAVLEMIRYLQQNIWDRAETPFFSALKEYSQKPITTFHAMPLTHGNSISGSHWASEFADFYGLGYFEGETSSTMRPLDSLFSPHHTLAEAMRKAAASFGSDRTWFVTNGTTGANSIVYQAIVRPGDVVVMDRNCHQSHHYAAIQVGARVRYMQPCNNANYGISLGVPLRELIEALHENKDKATLVAITHPTFDGVLYDPLTLIRAVHHVSTKVTFLFDEAWFAYGQFHPFFRSFTALDAVMRLREMGDPAGWATVFVTQSTHKTLSAMRQGSMIHACGRPFLDQTDWGTAQAFDRRRAKIRWPSLTSDQQSGGQAVRYAIDQALVAFETTSPNLHLLGALDVARMQAEMEGFDLLQDALQVARYIRHNLAAPSKGHSEEYCKKADKEPYSVVDETCLLKPNDIPAALEWSVDPLKITMRVPSGAGRFKEDILHEKFRIHINKYSHNTILILVTIGTSMTMGEALCTVFRQLQEANKGGKVDPVKLPALPTFHHELCSPIQDGPDKADLPPGCGTAKPDGQDVEELETRPGDLRRAYFLGLDPKETELTDLEKIRPGNDGCISATFVTPYPPGYPVLLPGQRIDHLMAAFLLRQATGGVVKGLEKQENSWSIRVFTNPDAAFRSSAAAPEREQDPESR